VGSSNDGTTVGLFTVGKLEGAICGDILGADVTGCSDGFKDGYDPDGAEERGDNEGNLVGSSNDGTMVGLSTVGKFEGDNCGDRLGADVSGWSEGFKEG